MKSSSYHEGSCFWGSSISSTQTSAYKWTVMLRWKEMSQPSVSDEIWFSEHVITKESTFKNPEKSIPRSTTLSGKAVKTQPVKDLFKVPKKQQHALFL